MYDQFNWTRASIRRNRLTAKYEPLQPFFLLVLAKRAGCQTFIDVGANIGVYSLFATLIPTVRQVVAFEADPPTLAELERNVRLNNLQDTIRAFGNAASDAVGTLSFGSVGHLSGANSVVSTSIHDASRFRDCYKVEATTLDHMLGKDPAGPIAIKIDVEGHEPAVLRGATSLLQSNSAVIQMEFYGTSRDESARQLKELGFGQLTAIGPDRYFTNIESLLEPTASVRAYECAASDLIAYYQRERGLMIEAGDFKLEIGGKSANLARELKRRIAGKPGGPT